MEKIEQLPLQEPYFIKPTEPFQERIVRWHQKKAKEDPGATFKIHRIKGKKRNYRLSPKIKKGVTHTPTEIIGSLYTAVSGSGDETYSRNFIAESIAALNNNLEPDLEGLSTTYYGAMMGMAPKDIIESQLSSRLLILNSKATHYVNLATTSEYERSTDLYLNRATKLMRLYNETLEAFNRYRRKGEQKVTVQHVHVNKGGQAVVANKFTPGRGSKKK